MTQKEIRTLLSCVALLRISPPSFHRDASGLLAQCPGVRVKCKQHLSALHEFSCELRREKETGKSALGQGSVHHRHIKILERS